MLFYNSEEGQEGRNAYVEKRRPDFSKCGRGLSRHPSSRATLAASSRLPPSLRARSPSLPVIAATNNKVRAKTSSLCAHTHFRKPNTTWWGKER